MELMANETYQLPKAYDPDQNALGIDVYLKASSDFPDMYPPFLIFDNETNTLWF